MPPLSNGTWKGSEGDTAMAFVDGELRLYKFHDEKWQELPKIEWFPQTDDFFEPWCEEHAEQGYDEPGCKSCLGQSHDAWMHRAKAAEHALREVLDWARVMPGFHINPAVKAAQELLGDD